MVLHLDSIGYQMARKKEASFEQLLLEKVKSNPSKGSTEKRQKLDFHGKVNLIFMRNIKKFQ